jgi:site-specific DNA recombinase
MKAILLARVSTEEQDTEPQLVRLKEYAELKGLVYTDKDVIDFDESAYKDERKKFDEVIGNLRKSKEVVALCCDKIDRLVRNFLLHLPVIDELRKSGKVELHFPSDNVVLTSKSPAADLFRFNMGVALAQYYSDSISDNVKRAIYKRMKTGQILGKSPYGYKNVTIDEDTKTVEVAPFEAQIVLKMYEWYATGAVSMLQLQQKLKQEFDIKMAKSMIGRILEDKFYIGIATYKKGGTEYPHIYEKIVPEYLFNQVQDIKSGRTQWQGKGKYAGKDFYYRGLISCQKCGYTVSPEMHRGKNYYRCTEYGGKHGAKYTTEVELTSQFTKAFEKITLDEELAHKVMQDIKRLNENNFAISDQLIQQLQAEQHKLRSRKSKLYDQYLDESITKEFYEEKLKQYDSEIGRIQSKLDSVQQVDKDFYVTTGYLIQLAKHSAELFKRSDHEERRLLINTVLLNVKWDGKKLSYAYQEPFNLLVSLKTRTLMGGQWGSNP